MQSSNENPWESLALGEIRREWWTPRGANQLPLLAARGAKPGRKLLLTGGVHGDEYEGPAAIQHLFSSLNPRELSGTLIGLPVLNMAAWNARSRVSSIDSLNLNRVFPGKDDEAAKPSEILAAQIFETFVRGCDAIIDLHSGGAVFQHLPLIGWYAGGTEAERLARLFGRQLHPWIIPPVNGVLSYEAHRAGKIALGGEWIGGGKLDLAGMNAFESGLRRVLAVLEMLPHGASLESDHRAPIAGDYQAAPEPGLFLPRLELGQSIERGQTLGVLLDELGNSITTVAASRSGIVAGLAHTPLLQAGDRIAYIG